MPALPAFLNVTPGNEVSKGATSSLMRLTVQIRILSKAIRIYC